ncbi:MAG: tetratricopeptide repeat protein, partial [Planctomycetes bacterium]|nr:tetratricopeptide repeat protein [Planctomycetota bacterium]
SSLSFHFGWGGAFFLKIPGGGGGPAAPALQFLERELPGHPGYLSLVLLKADLLAEAGRTSEAVACYRECIRANPNEMEPHLRLAEFHERRSEWTEALAEYDEALRLEPSDPFPRLMRASLLERMGRSAEAECERAAASGLRRLRGR